VISWFQAFAFKWVNLYRYTWGRIRQRVKAEADRRGVEMPKL
jgi:hypothetical protein